MLRRFLRAFGSANVLRGHPPEPRPLSPPRGVADFILDNAVKRLTAVHNAYVELRETNLRIRTLLLEAHQARVKRESGHYGDLCERIEAELGITLGPVDARPSRDPWWDDGPA